MCAGTWKFIEVIDEAWGVIPEEVKLMVKVWKEWQFLFCVYALNQVDISIYM